MCVPVNSGQLCVSSCVSLQTVVSSVCHHVCVPANSGQLCLSSCVCVCKQWSALSVIMCVSVNSGHLCLSSCLCLQTVVSSVCHHVCACKQWSAVSVITFLCVCVRARAPANSGQLSHRVYITDQLLSLIAQEPHKKAYLFKNKERKKETNNNNTKEYSEEKGKKKRKKKKKKEQQKEVAEQERREVESTNSPEIPDRRMTSDISGLPSWRRSRMAWAVTHQADKETETDKQTCFWVGAEEDVVIAQRHVT